MLLNENGCIMKHKEYLRKVRTIEFRVKGPEQEVALENLERELMKSLEDNLDIDWIKKMNLEELDDEELEAEYGQFF